jgi:hypothetical protein
MRLIDWVVQSGDEYAEAQALTQSFLGGGGGGVVVYVNFFSRFRFIK